jgi:hypothetical protein
MGIYWWLLALGGVALAGLAITYPGLSSYSINLYVLDVTGSGQTSVSSNLVQFRTPLIGSGLNFARNWPIGNWEASAVTRDSTGKFYISAWSSDEAQIRASTDLAQGFSTAVSGSSGGETFFTFPTALALDAVDNLYVADKGQLEPPRNALDPGFSTSSVLLFRKGPPIHRAEVLASATDDPRFFDVATGVGVDSHGNVYVVSGNDPTTSRAGSPLVAVFTRPGFHVHTIVGPIPDNQGSPTFPGYLTDPRQVALDDLGYIYVTNGAGSRGIVVFPPSPGALAAPFGEVNCADFRSPCGISICRKAIYVADPVARSVFVFGPLDIVPYGSGRRATPSRTITSGNADFAGPVGVYAVALPWFTRQRQSSCLGARTRTAQGLVGDKRGHSARRARKRTVRPANCACF